MEGEQTTLKREGHVTMLAISAVMFFSPFIKTQIAKSEDTSSDEKRFIAGYIHLGYINLILLLITTIAISINYWLGDGISQYVYEISCILMIICVIFGVIACICDFQLFKSTEGESLQTIEHKKLIFTAFIPIYNIIQRYQNQNFQKPYRRLKESLLRQGLFILTTLLCFNPLPAQIIIGFLIVRLLLIGANIDIIPNEGKKTINRLFLVNPEEIMGYLSGSISALLHKTSLQETIQKKKENYQKLQKIGGKIIGEYLLLLLLIGGRCYLVGRSTQVALLYGGLIIFIARYLISYILYKQLPHIPIIYECISIFSKKEPQENVTSRNS